MPTELIANYVPDHREGKRYYFHPTLVRQITIILIRAIFHLIAVLQAGGVENLPSKGPVLLAANHMTNLDVFAMQLVLPRPIFFMGKEELFRNPILDWLIRQLGGFPVYRGERDEWAIRHSEQVLEHRQVLGIFPEGKRSKGKGLHAGKTGAARLAITMECPIVPLAVQGTLGLFKGLPNRTKVTVQLGSPIYPQPDESPLALTDRLMFAIADLLPLDERGVYARRPRGF
ncbi:MAG TPA: lysophospholipid acyltransferase family protein [Anaerolineales bacterium]